MARDGSPSQLVSAASSLSALARSTGRSPDGRRLRILVTRLAVAQLTVRDNFRREHFLSGVTITRQRRMLQHYRVGTAHVCRSCACTSSGRQLDMRRRLFMEDILPTRADPWCAHAVLSPHGFCAFHLALSGSPIAHTMLRPRVPQQHQQEQYSNPHPLQPHLRTSRSIGSETH